MTGYIVRRLAYLVPVLLAVSLLAFGLDSLTPGDPARIMLQRRMGSPPSDQQVQGLREKLGLDDAFPVRYARWLMKIARGDLGTSFRTGEPVSAELTRHFLVTLEIAVPAFFVGLLIAIPLGILSAVRRNSVGDHTSRLGALIGASIPNFWLAYLLILLFAVTLGVLPVAGRGQWEHLVLPILTLSVGAAAGLMRLTRASLLEVMQAEYVRVARAKGMPQWTVIGRHALKNGLIPVVTLAGLSFGYLLGGAVIVETVFAWPGIGKYIVDAIYARDYPVIQGAVLLLGTVFVLVNLVVDLLYVLLDPRVRLGAKRDA